MRWTYCDNLIVFYFFRFLNCRQDNQALISSIAQIMSRTEQTVRMKIKNFMFLNGELGGLEHCSRASIQIYEHFNMLNPRIAIEEMRRICTEYSQYFIL